MINTFCDVWVLIFFKGSANHNLLISQNSEFGDLEIILSTRNIVKVPSTRN